MGKNMINDISYEEYSISYAELQDIINRKACEYKNKYQIYPKYIKMPIWVYQYCKTLPDCVCHSGSMPVETFFGFVLCPTKSIENPKDIEVF